MLSIIFCGVVCKNQGPFKGFVTDTLNDKVSDSDSSTVYLVLLSGTLNDQECHRNVSLLTPGYPMLVNSFVPIHCTGVCQANHHMQYRKHV